MVKLKNNNLYKANVLLAVFFLLFAAFSVLKHFYRDSLPAGLLQFTAEAALVGGIADWFAVSALFEKPLGFSWHTAIIPKNRERIADKVSELVGNELLGADSLRAKLEGISLTDSILDGLLGNVDKASLEALLTNLWTDKADGLDKPKLASAIASFLQDSLKKEELSKELRTLLIGATQDGRHKKGLSSLLGKATEVARRTSTKEKLLALLKKQERISEQRNEPGSFVMKIILNISRTSRHNDLDAISLLLQQELVDLLRNINHPGHPVFQKLCAVVEDLAHHLDQDGTLEELLQTWKNGVLDKLGLTEALQQLLTSAIVSESRKQEAAGWVAGGVEGYLKRLKEDGALKQSMEATLQSLLEKVILNEHHLIGEIAGETLSNFSDERLVRFINEKVGDDLQWIRINGSIVGATVGALLYLFTHLVFAPYLLPLLQF